MHKKIDLYSFIKRISSTDIWVKVTTKGCLLIFCEFCILVCFATLFSGRRGAVNTIDHLAYHSKLINLSFVIARTVAFCLVCHLQNDIVKNIQKKEP